MLLSSMSAENRTSAGFFAVSGLLWAQRGITSAQTAMNFHRDRMSFLEIEIIHQINRHDTRTGGRQFPNAPSHCIGRAGSSTVNNRYPTNTAPPFTLKISPVMKPACGVQRNKIGPAISSGVPTRPSGMVAKTLSRVGGSFNAGADMSVATQPGATQLMYMPSRASSVESPFTMLITAPLVAA